MYEDKIFAFAASVAQLSGLAAMHRGLIRELWLEKGFEFAGLAVQVFGLCNWR